MQLHEVDKRFSPRIAINLPVRLFPDNIESNIVNLSERGICLDSERPAVSTDILVSMDLSFHRPQKPIEIPAKVVWSKPSGKDKFYFGAQFSLLKRDHASMIKNFVFDSYAKEASARIKNEDLKIKVQDFFNKDVRQYYEDLFALSLKIDNQKAKSEEIEKRFTIFTNKVLQKGDALGKIVVDKAYMKKVKQTFRELIGCCVYKSLIVKRAYDKPRGYPGDYKLFEMIYNNRPLSIPNTIGFYWDKDFLNNEYTIAVRNRKDKMKIILKDFIENKRSSSLKILNIACGSCREIKELLSDPLLYKNKKLVFTCIDHDEEALEFSRSSLNNLPSNIELIFLKENILNLFRDNRYYDILGKQDIIYSLGLSEYLLDGVLKRLMYFLFQLLNDKGLLVITHKDKNIHLPSIPPDWFCDWTFVKRAEADLINMTKDLGSGKFSFKIEREDTGSILFLILTKNEGSMLNFSMPENERESTS